MGNLPEKLLLLGATRSETNKHYHEFFIKVGPRHFTLCVHDGYHLGVPFAAHKIWIELNGQYNKLMDQVGTLDEDRILLVVMEFLNANTTQDINRVIHRIVPDHPLYLEEI